MGSDAIAKTYNTDTMDKVFNYQAQCRQSCHCHGVFNAFMAISRPCFQFVNKNCKAL